MEAKQKLDSLLDDLSKANRLPRLSKAAHDVDRIIELLSEAREQIAGREFRLSQTASDSPVLPTDSRQQWTPTRRA